MVLNEECPRLRKAIGKKTIGYWEMRDSYQTFHLSKPTKINVLFCWKSRISSVAEYRILLGHENLFRLLLPLRVYIRHMRSWG